MVFDEDYVKQHFPSDANKDNNIIGHVVCFVHSPRRLEEKNEGTTNPQFVVSSL